MLKQRPPKKRSGRLEMAKKTAQESISQGEKKKVVAPKNYESLKNEVRKFNNDFVEWIESKGKRKKHD